jgi:hypothetical protein
VEPPAEQRLPEHQAVAVVHVVHAVRLEAPAAVREGLAAWVGVGPCLGPATWFSSFSFLREAKRDR